MPDIKPRSRQVTDGLERAAARGMLRAVGMGDEDFAKPQVAIASSWNEITPCNLSLERLATSAKEGVHAAGGYPLEFGTISVSDGISMGHEGMHFSLVSREIIADSVEAVVEAERLDGMPPSSPASGRSSLMILLRILLQTAARMAPATQVSVSASRLTNSVAATAPLTAKRVDSPIAL